MLDLFTPESQAGAYEWAAVFLAHFAIGLLLVSAMAAILDAIGGDYIDGIGPLSVSIVAVFYALLWEGAVQRFGAGFMDAAVDSFAVFMGALCGVSAWYRKGWLVAGSLIAMIAVALAGVRHRR